MPEEKKPGLSGGAKIGLGCLGLVMLIIVIAAISGGKKEITQQPVQPTKTEPEVKFVFDVPALVGKNIDEVRQMLGDPIDKKLIEPTKEQLFLGVKEWDNTFKKGDDELLVTFSPTTRKIVDFFLGGDDKNKLILLGNLNEQATNYKIELVKELKNPNNITGIKVIPK